MRISGPMAAGFAAQAFSITVWQAGLIVQKMLAEEMRPASIMLVQFGLAAAILWTWLLATGRFRFPDRRVLYALLWGMMAPGLVFGFGLAGAARTDGVSIALIWGLAPLFGPLLARLPLRESLHWSVPAGAAVSVCGIAVLTLQRVSIGVSDPLGNLLVLASVTLSTFSVLIGRVLNTRGQPVLQLATLQITGALATALIFTVASGWTPPDLDNPAAVGAVAYLVLFMTVLNFVAFNFALGRVPAALVALNGCFSPVVGMVSAWLLLGSVVTGADLVCAAVIIGGAAFPYLLRLRGSATGG